MSTALAACLVGFAASVAIERKAAAPGQPGPSLAALPARLALFGLLYLFWLSLWARPILAATACLVTLAIMTAISIRKRQLVGEPLAFSDFGLLRLIVRHPDLYYTEFMTRLPFLLGAAAFLACLGVWLWLEPAYRVLSPLASLVTAGGILLLVGLAWTLAARPFLADPLRMRVPHPDPERHIARWGLLLTLVAYGLRWQAETAGRFREPQEELALAREASIEPDLVVLMQLESFVDPARIGLPDTALPGLSRARDLSRFHGPLRVPAHGAFTMRSEHAVLTGLSQAELGFRAFDPYLTARGPAPATLASRLRGQGFRTIFLHPFRATFFGRDRVVPRLGFETLLFEEDFAEAERFGPYVSDRAMAERVLLEAENARGPALIMAVTMENHGPWTAGRLPEEPDPTRQYLRHLVNADAAISDLIDGLAARPGRALLCLFGDHPPILPGLLPDPQPETDYALLVFGDPEQDLPSPPVRLSADALGRLLARLSGAVTGDA